MKTFTITYKTTHGLIRTADVEGYIEYTAVARFKKWYEGKFVSIVKVECIG